MIDQPSTLDPRPSTQGIDRSTQAEASSAHSRINIPLNLENWKDVPEPVRGELLWFHQYALDAKLSLKDCSEALGYDYSTVFRVLKGTYEGSWKNIGEAIRSYKRLVETRGTIQLNEFVPNSISALIDAGLDYALANNSITVILGESRMGKTVAIENWGDRNNHGRSALVTAPPVGGTKALLRAICGKLGATKNQPIPGMLDACMRGFNRNRILIVDEAHRLLPNDFRGNPVNIEVLRAIHDQTKCGLALIATDRFERDMKRTSYMFEQLIGRIGMPVRLPNKIRQSDIDGIIRQYISRPSESLNTACLEMANAIGRLGIMVETLKVASRIAAKAKEKLGEEHVLKAIKLRKSMAGDLSFKD